MSSLQSSNSQWIRSETSSWSVLGEKEVTCDPQPFCVTADKLDVSKLLLSQVPGQSFQSINHNDNTAGNGSIIQTQAWTVPQPPNAFGNTQVTPQICPFNNSVPAKAASDLQKPEYCTDDFRMYAFKIQMCTRKDEHDWVDCPFAHVGEKALRRDPRVFDYSATSCPDFRKGQCKRGDMCSYAHGVFECWLHPYRYRTQLCQSGNQCTRKVCFFAHNLKEVRSSIHQIVNAQKDPSTASLRTRKAPAPLQPAASVQLPDTHIEEQIQYLGLLIQQIHQLNHGNSYAPQTNVNIFNNNVQDESEDIGALLSMIEKINFDQNQEAGYGNLGLLGVAVNDGGFYYTQN